MGLCILSAGKAISLAITAFTLSWMHSVEHTGWQEDYHITPAGLELVQARVKGGGAGMEPPPDAVLKDHWWVYTPHLNPLPELNLAASGATGGGWHICSPQLKNCLDLGEQAQAPIKVTPCDVEGPAGTVSSRG
jgi:hypothetical protein